VGKLDRKKDHDRSRRKKPLYRGQKQGFIRGNFRGLNGGKNVQKTTEKNLLRWENGVNFGW
jgi:hypothetical protein